jgi:undecaprenyl-diphosphatase
MMRASRDGGTRQVHHRPYLRFGLGIAVAAVVVMASWTLVVRPDVTPAEERLFRVVNTAPDVLWPLVWPPMQLGTIVAPVVVGGAAAAVLRRWRPPAAALIAGYTAWAAAQIVKATVVRDRPDALLTDVVLREGAQGLGFVSGHAAIATALATALWPYLSTRGRMLSLVLAAAVGLGRIYAGAHLPLDVVGGAAIGALAGIAANALVGLPSDRLAPPHEQHTA